MTNVKYQRLRLKEISEIKISIVSYLNSLPFLYGIEHSGYLNNYKLESDIPSVCAKKLLNEQVDIGLAPVAILPELKNPQIISDYCIGAVGKVKSVILVSNVPLQNIKSIYLDYQSRTSVNLIKILAKQFWKINPQWLQAAEGYESSIKDDIAGLIIGDRAFNSEPAPPGTKYSYIYDLADEWNKYTNLPFVFACWICNKKFDETFIENFNKALKFGINNINNAVNKYYPAYKLCTGYNNLNIEEYLTHNISYSLDKDKLEGMKLFLKYSEELN